ncbi:MAG: DUF308 domain-containing protein [Bacteroides sp.]|nr:DUF308 domain-containing protein [Bacteroides sp.]
MKTANLNYWGSTRYWWIMLIVGIAVMLGGFAYFLWPVIGYPVASMVFGWLLVLCGIVALIVSVGKDRPRGWGWWLACGIINTFVGFMLVRNVILSEVVFPYFIAIILATWGIGAIFSSVSQRGRKYWWLYLINGILLLVVAFLLMESNFIEDMMMVSLLTSIAFIYWGFCLSMVSLDMRPIYVEEVEEEVEKEEKRENK